MGECTEAQFPCGADPEGPCMCPHVDPRQTGWPQGPTRKPPRSIRYSARYVDQMRALGLKRFPLQPVPDETH